MDERTVGDEFLRTAVTRRSVLAALAERPHRRDELQDRLDFSKSTCHRVIRSFEDDGLVGRADGEYELTALGHAVASQVEQFTEGVQASVRLEPLVAAFGEAAVSFDAGLFADATVTRPTPEDPTPPVDRHLDLFEGSERIRTLDRTSFTPPLYVERMFELAVENDTDGEVILPASIVEKRLSTHPEIHRRLSTEGVAVEYRVHDDVPFGMTIYGDESVGLRAYDDDTGALLLFADTDDPDAVGWATQVFDHYSDRSQRASAVDGLAELLPESDPTP